MKAITYSAFGGSDQLAVSDVPAPQPGDGEVLIAIKYAAVNPLDWKIRDGAMQGRMPFEFPIIPGCDAAGIVTATGPGATKFSVGDRVFCYARKDVFHDGTYAEAMAVAEPMLALVPDAVDLAAAAAAPVSALTAWQGLHDFGQLQSGQTVLVTAGAGGVGSFAIQIARHAGATVIATGSAANHDYMKSLGAEHTIDYTAGSVPEAVREVVAKGCDLVLDCAGGPAYEEGVQSLAPGGRIATIVSPPDEEAAAAGGYTAGFIFSMPNGEQLASIASLMADGHLKPPQLDLRSVKDAAKAQDDSKAGHTRGKIVLEIDFDE